jgi:tetratricopeptide (TPR) repeat protein
MTKKFRYIPLLLSGILFFFAAHMGPVFAKDQKAAEAKIQALNDQIVAANENKDLPAALRAAEEAVQVAKTGYGENSLQAADTMNNLANLYLYIKRAPEAERLYKKAILIDLGKLDKEGVEIAAIYFNLGVAYAMQKKYNPAIDILNKALNIRLKKLGRDDAATKNVEQMIAELTKLAYPNEVKI